MVADEVSGDGDVLYRGEELHEAVGVLQVPGLQQGVGRVDTCVPGVVYSPVVLQQAPVARPFSRVLVLTLRPETRQRLQVRPGGGLSPIPAPAPAPVQQVEHHTPQVRALELILIHYMSVLPTPAASR